MSWYNTYSDSTKKLEAFIESQPTLQQLLDYPQFLQLLKAYQPKLLEYITSSSQIPRDIIKYITQPPLQSDTQCRKFKLPLLTMLMIQTNTTCVINSFFRIDLSTQKTFFVNSFFEFLSKDQQLLPLLCGYFSQFNLILWNNRYKQTIDLIYEAQQPLFLLAKHSYSKAIVNTLLLYLNLDLTRNSNSPPERVNMKLQVIKQLYDQLRGAFENYKKEKVEGKYDTITENIGEVLIEIIEKYYLISDGKAMLQIIASQQNVSLVVQIFMSGGSIAMAAANIMGWLMRYYCLSSFNTQDPQNIELNKRNQQRLQSQPFPKIVIELLPKIAQILNNSAPFTLYHSKLLQIFNMSLELSSRKIVEVIKKSKYIQIILSLLFKFPQLSIVHKMVQKLFYLIFNSDKSVFEQYRKYLFCQANLIEITIGNYIGLITDLNQFRLTISSFHEGYFAYLMRIIKIYSKIQTNDDEINKSIMQRSAIWEQFSSFILQPFEALCFKDLGSYENVPERTPVQYTIKCITGGLSNNQQVSKKVLEEINQEESMQKFKTQQPEKPQEESKSGGLSQDALFNVQEFNGPQKQQKKTDFQSDISMPQNVIPDSFEHQLAPNPAIHIQIPAPKVVISHINPPETPLLEEPKKLPQPEPNNRKYEQFLNSKKQEVDKELKMQRTNSTEKRLSANKSRVTSPSPKKKRWDDSGNQEEQKVAAPKLVPAVIKPTENDAKKQKISLTTPNMRPPMIPHSKAPPTQPNNISISSKNQSKSEPKKVEASKDISPRLGQNLSKQDSVTSSINSLPEIKISEATQKEQKVLSDQRSTSTAQLASSQLVYRNVLLEESRKLSKSAINLSDLKNVQFRRERVLKPEKSEYRMVEEKDRIFLDFLGVKY